MGEYLGCIEHGANKYCTTSAATYQNTFVSKMFSQQATTKNACTLSKYYQNIQQYYKNTHQNIHY